MSVQIHGYFWDGARLQRILDGFADGQFQLVKRKEGLMFRGEIKSCEVASNGSKEVVISFNWLCEQRNQRWFLKPQPPPPVSSPRLNVCFNTYYSQPDEERVKMWGGGWEEVCHFFKKGDHTNLVDGEGRFVPYCDLHKTKLWQVVVAMLLNKK